MYRQTILNSIKLIIENLIYMRPINGSVGYIYEIGISQGSSVEIISAAATITTSTWATLTKVTTGHQ